MPINLKIKYFVHFDQLMGKTEVFEVEDGLMIKDLFRILAEKHNGFNQSNAPERLITLLNGTVCSTESMIHDGDEISILNPLVGG